MSSLAANDEQEGVVATARAGSSATSSPSAWCIPNLFGSMFALEHLDMSELFGAFVASRGAILSVGSGLFARCTSLLTVVNLEVLSPAFERQGYIPSGFLAGCRQLRTISFKGVGKGVKKLGAGFLMNSLSLEVVDCSGFTEVEEVGSCFLAGCLSLKRVDLSGFAHALKRIGTRFMAAVALGFNNTHFSSEKPPSFSPTHCTSSDPIAVLDLSPLHRVEQIPSHFLTHSFFFTGTQVNFSQLTAVRSIGDHFLSYAEGLADVDLSPSCYTLQTIGSHFLFMARRLHRVRLGDSKSSETSKRGLTKIGRHFLSHINNHFSVVSEEKVLFEGNPTVEIDRSQPAVAVFEFAEWKALRHVQRYPAYFLSCSLPSSLDLQELHDLKEVGPHFLEFYPRAVAQEAAVTYMMRSRGILSGTSFPWEVTATINPSIIPLESDDSTSSRTVGTPLGSEGWRLDLRSQSIGKVFHSLRRVSRCFLAGRPIRVDPLIALEAWGPDESCEYPTGDSVYRKIAEQNRQLLLASQTRSATEERIGLKGGTVEPMHHVGCVDFALSAWFPNVERIGYRFMANLVGLRSVDLSGMHRLRRIGADFLTYCPHLVGCNLGCVPSLEGVGDSCLRDCISFNSRSLHCTLQGENWAEHMGELLRESVLRQQRCISRSSGSSVAGEAGDGSDESEVRSLEARCLVGDNFNGRLCGGLQFCGMLKDEKRYAYPFLSVSWQRTTLGRTLSLASDTKGDWYRSDAEQQAVRAREELERSLTFEVLRGERLFDRGEPPGKSALCVIVYDHNCRELLKSRYVKVEDNLGSFSFGKNNPTCSIDIGPDQQLPQRLKFVVWDVVSDQSQGEAYLPLEALATGDRDLPLQRRPNETDEKILLAEDLGVLCVRIGGSFFPPDDDTQPDDEQGSTPSDVDSVCSSESDAEAPMYRKYWDDDDVVALDTTGTGNGDRGDGGTPMRRSDYQEHPDDPIPSFFQLAMTVKWREGDTPAWRPKKRQDHCKCQQPQCGSGGGGDAGGGSAAENEAAVPRHSLTPMDESRCELVACSTYTRSTGAKDNDKGVPSYKPVFTDENLFRIPLK